MAASGFLYQNLFRWWGPTNDGFCPKMNAASVARTIIGGRDTQILLAARKKYLCILWQWGCKKIWTLSILSLGPRCKP